MNETIVKSTALLIPTIFVFSYFLELFEFEICLTICRILRFKLKISNKCDIQVEPLRYGYVFIFFTPDFFLLH